MLRYVDGILIASLTASEYMELVISLLNFLVQSECKVSRKKAQIVKQEVVYLGFIISHGQKSLGQERKEKRSIKLLSPFLKQLRAFLGMVRWGHLWILNFELIAKPLYEAVNEKDEVLIWTPECRKDFQQLKYTLMTAPALGLPDLEKPFELLVHESSHLALGILTQWLGSWKTPVAYFSKQLDDVVLLIQEAKKLTLGQQLIGFVLHSYSGIGKKRRTLVITKQDV